MANILDRYGIKEVADVVFYELGPNGRPTHPVLYLDTLKVSTVEFTADPVEQKGGKGNATLIMWDSNKEINVTLEDALFSAKSLEVMFGRRDAKVNQKIVKTMSFTCATSSSFDIEKDKDGQTISTDDAPKFFTADGSAIAEANLQKGETYYCSYVVNASDVQEITISANTFPHSYYVVGETYSRAEDNGKDEFFQLIMPKAKVLSENTLTLEADGDPTVFSMNLRLLRTDNGGMIKLVKYTTSDDKIDNAVIDSVKLEELTGKVSG